MCNNKQRCVSVRARFTVCAYLRFPACSRVCPPPMIPGLLLFLLFLLFIGRQRAVFSALTLSLPVFHLLVVGLQWNSKERKWVTLIMCPPHVASPRQIPTPGPSVKSPTVPGTENQCFLHGKYTPDHKIYTSYETETLNGIGIGQMVKE